jgi:hypothetical protein
MNEKDMALFFLKASSNIKNGLDAREVRQLSPFEVALCASPSSGAATKVGCQTDNSFCFIA